VTERHGKRVWPPIPQDPHVVRTSSTFLPSLWQSKRHLPAMDGLKSGRQHLGGYRQALERILEVIHAKE